VCGPRVAVESPLPPVRTRALSYARLGIGLVLGGFLSFVFGNALAITTGLLTPLQAALASFVVLGLGVFMYGRSGSEASLAPARFVRRLGSALVLACPYCGTPMRAVGSGLANCVYCETRFRVP
jgi:uncharacterized Zn-finger protein